MKQEGMTFDHDFCYFILLFSSLLKKEGREKENDVAKIVIKSHTFLFHLGSWLFPVLHSNGYHSFSYCDSISCRFFSLLKAIAKSKRKHHLIKRAIKKRSKELIQEMKQRRRRVIILQWSIEKCSMNNLISPKSIRLFRVYK